MLPRGGIACIWRLAGASSAADGKAARARQVSRVIAAVAVVLLVGYWALMTFVPVPGYGAGHLGKDDNLGAYIDRALMGGHLWSESETWDPEGLLSTLPAIATTAHRDSRRRMAAFGSQERAQSPGTGDRRASH